MSTELVTFSDEQVLLIKNQICPGITDPELQLFITQCKRTGLDPFSKQVYAVKRWDSKTKTEKMAIQFSIDGFRVIAERTGKYAGQLGPFWCGEDGAWREVWIDVNPPVAAKVGILRKDFQEPLWGVAKFDTYAQRDKDGNLTRFWRMMPEVMIAKCAESVGLRRAFPQDLSGCYTSDEMGQADVVDVEVAELQVLRGGTQVLSTLRPIVFVEISLNHEQTRDFLRALGYRLFAPDGTEETGASGLENHFALHRDAHAHLIRGLGAE